MTPSREALLLTAPDCHLCEQARRVLQRLSEEVPLQRIELAWSDPHASALVQRDGIPFPPALYIDGELWAYGRLSERALRKKFAASETTLNT